MHSMRWLFRFALCVYAGAVFAQAPAPASAPVPPPAILAAEIGVAERLNGTVTVTPAGGQARPLSQNDAVREGDLVATEANSEVLIKLRDDTTLALRQQSQMRLAEFRFEKGSTDSFVGNLLKGSVRKVSGLIAKAQPRNVRLTTPTATVGIRGTDFEVMIVDEESERTRAGTYDYVNDGRTFVQIASGETLEVTEDQTGLALAFPRPGEAPLQLINGRPAFLRGGGFDAMMMRSSAPPMLIMPRR